MCDCVCVCVCVCVCGCVCVREGDVSVVRPLGACIYCFEEQDFVC